MLLLQVPYGIAVLLDRDNWLRNNLHDPYVVLPGTHDAGPVPSENALQLDEIARTNSACMRAPHRPDNSPITTESCDQVGGEWKLAAVHGEHGNRAVVSQTGAESSCGKPPVLSTMPRAQNNLELGGKLLAFRKQQNRCSSGVVVELSKKRLAYRAGKFAAGYGVGIGSRDAKSKQWSVGRLKDCTDRLEPSKSGTIADTTSTDKAHVPAEPSNKTQGRSAGRGRNSGESGVRCRVNREEAESSKYYREEPPPISIEVPDFDSEHGYTHGFYDPDSYTMYIL